jgi:hypothetical protein
MVGKDRVMSKAREMARVASETHVLVKKNAGRGEGDEQSSRDAKGSVWNSHPGERMPKKDRAMSSTTDMAKEGSETQVLVNSSDGQGDEQSSRDGKGSVWNPRSGEKECRQKNRNRVMSKAAETERKVSETHVLVKEFRGRTGRWTEQQWRCGVQSHRLL